MKVAIFGCAPSDVPISVEVDETWERWCINDGYLVYPHQRFTAWWELHGDTPLTRDRRPKDHFDRIKAMDIPVYYLHGDPPTPNAIKLDTDELAAVGRDYFACTFAYQIALAMKMGAAEIAMYGTPLATNREIVVERPCVAYWLGLAEGRGIKVSVYHTIRNGLMRHPYRYALDDWEERNFAMESSVQAMHSIETWLPSENRRLGHPAIEMLTEAE